MRRLLADSFREFGSSGREYDKKEIIAALRVEPSCQLSLQDFRTVPLSQEVVLVTYRATRRSADSGNVSHSLRCSIWKRQNGIWQVVFHQGTPSPSSSTVCSRDVGVKLETGRLILRPLVIEDAPVVARLAGRREIADTTLSIPHPYSEQQAREWIAMRSGQGKPGKEVVFALTLKPDGKLIGAMGLGDIGAEHCHAEMGFWIGVDCWGKGFATEAARAVIRFGFEELKLNRIYAHYMVRNPASGRVLDKVGMRREGLLRQRMRKWGVFEDVVLMAILRDDWISLEKLSQRGI